MRVPGIPYVQGRNDYTDWDGRKYGIAIHNTSNDASDEGEASYATRRTDGVSSHLYVDDDSVTQSLDTDDRAGHAGSREGNDHSIAVEITGSNGKSRAWWLANVAWDRLGWVLAWIITNDPDYRGFEVRRASVAEMRANPRVKAFYGHNDMRLAWGGTTHTDPGPNFPWDRLFRAVNEHLEEDDMPTAAEVAKATVDELLSRRVTSRVTGNEVPLGATVLGGGYEQAYRAREGVAELRTGQKAVLAAVQGLDTDAVIAAVERRSAEDAARDAEMQDRLDAAAEERAAIAELVASVASGEREASEVVDEIHRRLAPVAPAPAGDQG